VLKQKIEMYRGDNQQFAISAKTVVAGVTTIPDITNWKIWMTGKLDTATDDDNEAVFQITTPTDITITDGAGGLAVATLPTGATSALTEPTIIKWDIQAKEAGGAVHTLAGGTLHVHLDATISTAS